VRDPDRFVNGGDEGRYTIHGHTLAIVFTFTPHINGETFGDKAIVEVDGDKIIHPVVGTFVRQPSPWTAPNAGGAKVEELQGKGPLGSASMVFLGEMNGGRVRGAAISSGGTTVVGEAIFGVNRPQRPVRWTREGGLIDLGWPEEGQDGSGSARAVSADGSTVAGDAYLPCFRAGEAVRFSALGMLALLAPKERQQNAPGIHFQFGSSVRASAFAVSADGSTLAGTAATNRGPQAFRWTQQQGRVWLNTFPIRLPPGQSQAYGISGDGAVVVGETCSVEHFPAGVKDYRACRWTDDVSAKELKPAPEYHNFIPWGARAISRDGKVIIGAGGGERPDSPQFAFRWTEAGNAVPLDCIPDATDNTRANAVSGDGSIVGGTSNVRGSGYRAVVWETSTGVHELQAALKRDYGLDVSEWRLTEVRGITEDGRTFMGTGFAATDGDENIFAVRTWVVTLTPGGETLFSKETRKPIEFPKGGGTGGGGTGAPAQLGKVPLFDLEIPGGATNPLRERPARKTDLAPTKPTDSNESADAAKPRPASTTSPKPPPASKPEPAEATPGNVSSLPEPLLLKGHTNSLRALAFTPDGKTLATAGVDGDVKVWDLAAGKEQAGFRRNPFVIRALAVSADGRLLAAAGGDRFVLDAPGAVRILDPGTGQQTARLEGHAGMVMCAAFTSDGKTLATGSTDGTAKLWDAATWKELRSLDHPSERVVHVALSADGAILATGCDSGTVRLWDVGAGTEKAKLKGVPGVRGSGVLSLAFSRDGKTLAAGNFRDNSVSVWDVASGEARPKLTGHTRHIVSLAFSPDDQVLASGSIDGTVRLWEVATGKQRGSFAHEQSDTAVAFTADGKLLIATSTKDGSVKLWSTPLPTD
jgi:WD40 repeat protein